MALLRASTRDILYIFSADGRFAAYPVHQLPEGAVWEGRGRAISDLVSLGGDFPAVAALVRSEARSAAECRPEYLFLATRRGMVKRVAAADLPAVGSGTAIGIAEGDAVVGAAWTTGTDEVMLVTRAGQAIRFREEEVRPMGLPAGGVAGIKLQEIESTERRRAEEDRVVALVVVRPKEDLAVVAEDGRGKRTPLSEYPTQGRYGKGVITARFAAPGVGLAGRGLRLYWRHPGPVHRDRRGPGGGHPLHPPAGPPRAGPLPHPPAQRGPGEAGAGTRMKTATNGHEIIGTVGAGLAPAPGQPQGLPLQAPAPGGGRKWLT